MPLITRRDESYSYAPDAFAFWRNQAVYFCLFSVLGHWMEIAYCSFMNIFGIVDPESLVWDDPMYPFCVYGIGVLVCALALMPLRIQLVRRRKTMAGAAVEFFIIAVLVCMAMELTMGLMLNQPDAAGQLSAVGQLATARQHPRPSMDRQRRGPGRRGHAIHLGGVPAVPKSAGESAHPHHECGFGHHRGGVRGAVRREVLLARSRSLHKMPADATAYMQFALARQTPTSAHRTTPSGWFHARKTTLITPAKPAVAGCSHHMRTLY